MIPLSSIFSFKTLQGSFRPGKALLFAMVLLLAVEGGLRLFPPRLGWYEAASSLEQWVLRLGFEIRERSPSTWLMGNSVLAYGVDEERLEEQTGLSMISLPFGGATFAGQAAMMEYFLHRAPNPPKQVVFCVTKDDFNVNGERSWISKRYLQYDTWHAINLKRLFRLADTRNTLMNVLRSFILPETGTDQNNPDEPSFEGTVLPEKYAYMRRLMQDYTLDEQAFSEVAALAGEYGFSVIIVMVPVTDAYIQFHNESRVDLPYDEVIGAIRTQCEQAGFRFSDASQMDVSNVAYYMDPYHLTALGRARFTPWLAAILMAQDDFTLPPLRRIACIGDSITWGTPQTCNARMTYPLQLERKLGGIAQVGNFGVSGTTLLRNSGRAWCDTPAFQRALQFKPDVVVILFGINDLAHLDILGEFPRDGIWLVRQFQQLHPTPSIFLCTPTPLVPPEVEREANQRIEQELIPYIHQIAEVTGATVIPVYEHFPKTQKLLPDTVHPNIQGAEQLAQIISNAL